MTAAGELAFDLTGSHTYHRDKAHYFDSVVWARCEFSGSMPVRPSHRAALGISRGAPPL